MNRLTEILGLDTKKLWSLRDTVLMTIAGIAIMWAIVAFLAMDDEFDKRLGIASVVVAAICCGVSPNRVMVFTVAVGWVAVQGWFAVVMTRDIHAWWVAGIATLVAAAMLFGFRDRPVREK